MLLLVARCIDFLITSSVHLYRKELEKDKCHARRFDDLAIYELWRVKVQCISFMYLNCQLTSNTPNFSPKENSVSLIDCAAVWHIRLIQL